MTLSFRVHILVLKRHAAGSIVLYGKDQMSSGLPGNAKNGSSRVSPRGPVFLSYRHSDGADLAIALAWGPEGCRRSRMARPE